jgi:carbon-monoxide dehydrogenase medium subunit
MKAAAFVYVRAANLDDAVGLLAGQGGRAKLLAGGQSLLPMLNLRLLAPEVLVDIGGIAGLRGIEIEGGTVRIGALTRHVDLLLSPDVARHAPLLAQAVPHIAHPAIRNRGTIGGSLAHADPASELPACMLALGATMIVRGPRGERRITARDFFTGLFQTALAPDEILTAVTFSAADPDERVWFHEFARRAGDYAMAGLAARARMAGGHIAALRLAFFGVGDRATLCPAAAEALMRPFTPAALAEAQALLVHDLNAQTDHQASAATRMHLARVLLARCIGDLAGHTATRERLSA